MADTLSTLAIIAFVLAGLCLVAAVFLWFYFKIPRVIGDLNGKTARKSIAKMREDNENSGQKSYRPSPTNLERGRLTDTVHPNRVTSGRMSVTAPPQANNAALSTDGESVTEKIETGVLGENQATPTVDTTAALGGVTAYAEETAPLYMPPYAEETAPLNELPDANETELLSDNNLTEETALLSTSAQDASGLMMLEQVMLIHTNEVIPL